MNTDSPVLRRPGENLFVEVELSSGTQCGSALSSNTVLWDEIACMMLEDAQIVRQRHECGETPAKFGSFKNVNLNVVCPGGRNGPGDKIAGTIADYKSASRVKQATSPLFLQLVPELIRTEHQRNVVGALEICLPDDARTAMRRALVVRRSELIESQNPLSSLCEMLSSRAAHGSEAEDDHIEGHS
jgi:hypothetical protein